MNTVSPFASVQKRDGRQVPFDQAKITGAVARAMEATGEGNLKNDPERISDLVIGALSKKYPPTHTPHIEEIQDVVEETLILADLPKTAKAYILYRKQRAEIRDKQVVIPERVRQLTEESKQYFKNELAEFIYYRTYSRWIEGEGRRETWVETVDRYMQFMRQNLGAKLSDAEYDEIRSAILRQEVMPSMRLMWSAGEAARKSNVSAYNCSYIAPAQLRDFSEIMYLLMCGAGVGFSVESQTAQQLPIVKPQTGAMLPAHVIADSREGWADALLAGLEAWFGGNDVTFDFSQVRPAGSRLKTMGGRSAGPEPLRMVLSAVRQKVLSRQGKRLRNIDVHDVVCKIGECVVAGGVRRSALISLSDLDDEEMRDAKKGEFYLAESQRSMANNSAVYTTQPTAVQFMEEWLALAKSGTGERGIFNRGGLKDQVPARRWPVLEKDLATCGSNPCGEIILKSKQFCNLTEIVARDTDTRETLVRKARLAAILGTYQSTLTDFRYLSEDWKKHCEEERLLGVSITGQWDCAAVRDSAVLAALRDTAVAANKEFAGRFGINQSTAVTCVKPSGTVSQLVDAASGMHPRHAQYYIRRVRISATDPLFQMLKEEKYPYYPEVGQQGSSATTFVLEFPVRAPEGAKTRNDVSALEHLEYWKAVKTHFTEHNPSVTISLGENEWIEAAHWLYRNWSILGGLSFLPRADYVYQLAPYEEITKEQYKAMASRLPPIDFSQVVVYEKEDNTVGAQELACIGNTCEVDIGTLAAPFQPLN